MHCMYVSRKNDYGHILISQATNICPICKATVLHIECIVNRIPNLLLPSSSLHVWVNTLKFYGFFPPYSLAIFVVLLSEPQNAPTACIRNQTIFLPLHLPLAIRPPQHCSGIRLAYTTSSCNNLLHMHRALLCPMPQYGTEQI